MSTLHKFHVAFWLKKRSIRKDGTMPIYVRIKLDGVPTDISTQESTLEKHWCSVSQRMKPRIKTAKQVNDRLDEIKSDIKSAYYELKKKGRPITAQAIKSRYLKQDNPVLTLNDLIIYHTENELKKLAPGTAKNYGATQRYIARFIKSEFNAKDLHLAFIDYSVVIKFENYLRFCKPLKAHQPLNNNGIMKHLERFQKFTTLAFKHGWIKDNPFLLYELGYDNYDSDFLEPFELELWENLKLKSETLRKVRDIFVFSCYTGLSYIEVKNLKAKDIVTGIDGNPWIILRRRKSDTEIKVPLMEKAKEILDRYNEYPHPARGYSLLPVYSTQKVNKYLKDIAKICDIGKHLTFHVARHTFATTVTLLNNVPIETVSKMLGHTKLSTTQKYARVLERKISEDMKELQSKISIDSKKKTTKRQDDNSHLRIV